MMEYFEFCNSKKLRSFGKFIAKQKRHQRGFRNDPLQYRARLAEEISQHEKDGRICVVVYGTDCDGVFFERNYEIAAGVIAFLAFRKNEESYADGRLHIDILTKEESI